MTISTETRTAGPFDGTGVAVTYPFAFKVFAASDVAVWQSVDDETEVQLTYGQDYSVVLNANQETAPGGTVTLTTVLPVGKRISITSDQANLQALDLTNQGGFFPEDINDALDRIVIMVQQLREWASRAIRTQFTSLELPEDVKADMYAARDAAVSAASGAASSQSAAAGSANTASTKASEADASADAAADSATAAQNSATAAADSETAAQNSATAAASSATEAQTLVDSFTTQEAERVAAESARVTAETEREDYYTQIKAEVEAGEFDGAAATIEVGATQTVPYGTDASVENTGTESAAVFKFSIPQGAPGVQGPTGLVPKGSYDTLEDLKAAHPTGAAGDAYMVGSHVYYWSTEAAAWKDAGTFGGIADAPQDGSVYGRRNGDWADQTPVSPIAGDPRPAQSGAVANALDTLNQAQLLAVKLTGDQSVGGVKTFSQSPVIPDATEDQNPTSLAQVNEIVAGAMSSGSSRGVVLNALTSQGQSYTITSATIAAAGTGYTQGDALFLSADLIDAIVVVESVGGNGEITSASLSKGGDFSADPAGESVSFTGGTGTGAAFALTTALENNTSLPDISTPKSGDEATVLQDEIHGGTAYDWAYADYNGDGIFNWVPLRVHGSSNRDFVAYPIQQNELGPAVVSIQKLSTPLQAIVGNLSPMLIYVDISTGNDTNDGNSWDTPLATVEAALDKISYSTQFGFVVLVKSGNYPVTRTASISQHSVRFVASGGDVTLDYSSIPSGVEYYYAFNIGIISYENWDGLGKWKIKAPQEAAGRVITMQFVNCIVDLRNVNIEGVGNSSAGYAQIATFNSNIIMDFSEIKNRASIYASGGTVRAYKCKITASSSIEFTAVAGASVNIESIVDGGGNSGVLAQAENGGILSVQLPLPAGKTLPAAQQMTNVVTY
jgi:hypothetical protein